MDLIQQTLIVRDWPLKKPGDEGFFGYVVAIGLFPCDSCADGALPFVDFAFNERYVRYRLPYDEGLRKQLLHYLSRDLDTFAECGDVYGKVWVRLTDQGYKVDLP